MLISIACSPVNFGHWLFLLYGLLLSCNLAESFQPFYRHRTGNSHLNLQYKSSKIGDIFPPKARENYFNHGRLVGGKHLGNITLLAWFFSFHCHFVQLFSYKLQIIHLHYVNLTQSHKQVKHDLENL